MLEILKQEANKTFTENGAITLKNLSTNEEINSKHVSIMKDRIAVTYMLENVDNTRTTISRNAYFEE